MKVKRLTAAEAADVLKCHVNHVYWLCNNGKLKAVREMKVNKNGYQKQVWSIESKSVHEYANTPQEIGFPRGEKRDFNHDLRDREEKRRIKEQEREARARKRAAKKVSS